MVDAMKARVGSSGRKLVLIKLADNANDEGYCWPSYQNIADHCEMGRSTVKSHIKQLEKDGFLTVIERNGGKSSNRFQLHVSQGQTKERTVAARSNPDPVKVEPGQNQAHTQSDPDPHTRSDPDPRTSHSLEPIKEPVTLGSATAKPSAKELLESNFELLWSVYPKREGSNPKNKALSAYRASIKRGHSHEAIAEGLYRYTKHCQTKNTINTQFVMTGARFFGPGDEFKNTWEVCAHDGSRSTTTGKPSLAERQEAQGRAALDLIGIHEASSGAMDSNGTALPQQMGIPRGTTDDRSGWSGTPILDQRQIVGEENAIPA